MAPAWRSCWPVHDQQLAEELFPAASLAVMVMVFIPSIRRMGGVDHCVVPMAAPEPVVELFQDTEATPTLSEAVPMKTMLDADV